LFYFDAKGMLGLLYAQKGVFICAKDYLYHKGQKWYNRITEKMGCDQMARIVRVFFKILSNWEK
jgi:hypothetical protein